MPLIRPIGLASVVDRYLLSVVIPVHNLHGRYDNLKSWILKPCSSQIQIIFVLDEVHESAKLEFKEEVLSRISNDYEIISDNFGGPGISRNSGMTLANGKYLAFIDADDIPNIAEYLQLIERMEVSNADLGIGSFQKVDILTGFTQDKTFATQSLDKNLKLVAKNPGLWRMVFTTSDIQRIEFPPIRMGEDQIFIARALQNVKRIEFSRNLLYKYFINQTNQLTNSKIAIDDLGMSISLLGEILNQRTLKWRGILELMYLKMLLSRFLTSEKGFSIDRAISTYFSLKSLKFGTFSRLLPACFRLIT